MDTSDLIHIDLTDKEMMDEIVQYLHNMSSEEAYSSLIYAFAVKLRNGMEEKNGITT